MTKLGCLLGVVVFAGLLSGCTTTGPDGISVTHIKKKAVSGERTKLGNAVLANRDCTSGNIPNTRITESPRHGKTEIVHEKVFRGDFKGDFTKCNNTKFPASVTYYTSTPGYIGKDELRSRISFGNGKISDYIVEIDVVK